MLRGRGCQRGRASLQAIDPDEIGTSCRADPMPGALFLEARAAGVLASTRSPRPESPPDRRRRDGRHATMFCDFTRSVKPMALGLVVLQLGGGARASIWGLVLQAGPFAKGVLILLLVMSVICWGVIWNRARLYSRVERADRGFLAAFRRLSRTADFRLVCEQHPNSLLARVAMVGQRALEQHP